MSSITQIISFVAKSTVDFEYLSNAAKAGTKGLQRQFLGIGLEPNARAWLLEWDAETKSGIVDFEKILEPVTSEPIKNVHVAFSESLAPSLAAPVTEILFSKMKPEQDLVAFGKIASVSLQDTIIQPGSLGTSWGYTSEIPKSVVLVVGWENVEAHKNFAKTEFFRISCMPYLEGVTESSVSYYKFQ
ncbi:hypothetical protein PILCRDRAFT_816887 [Piloderma croceum F 1598]|uniref:ABM domain-containing protein n=1 Tax=Piloderma croceum (strain F 1598) TaxID=765440 RepID=A0A0C3G1I7_PILCF|nr:hypothetical protein PILCRDRAFT_816887 [Piloderma croceum F 1598]